MIRANSSTTLKICLGFFDLERLCLFIGIFEITSKNALQNKGQRAILRAIL